MIKRVYMDSTLWTSYCQGGHIHTKEGKASPKDSQLFLSICFPLQHCLVTRINELSYYKPSTHLFPSLHYPSAQPLHIDVMYPTDIVLEVSGFSQVKASRAHRSLTALHPSYMGMFCRTFLVIIMMTMFDINCSSQPQSTSEIRLPAFPRRKLFSY